MALKVFIFLALVGGIALGMTLPGKAAKPSPHQVSQFHTLSLS